MAGSGSVSQTFCGGGRALEAFSKTRILLVGFGYHETNFRKLTEINVNFRKLTDLPVKGQIFHREAENRLSRRPRDEKKNSILNEF